MLVTGASSDIGAALIRRVAGNYGTVVAHYGRSAEKVLALRDSLGEKIVPLGADFTNETAVLAFAEKVREFAPEHFVHMPAAPFTNNHFPKIVWEDYALQLNIQLRSAVVICRALLPDMAKHRAGKTVFMLTDNVTKSIPGKYAIAYTTAKYALLGFMKCLAAEYASKGVTINAVSTSMVETRFNAVHPELTVQMNAEASPLKRNLTVNEVVPSLEFLLSLGADAITGQNLPVTGGA